VIGSGFSLEQTEYMGSFTAGSYWLTLGFDYADTSGTAPFTVSSL
jgi:hypothetical protein